MNKSDIKQVERALKNLNGEREPLMNAALRVAWSKEPEITDVMGTFIAEIIGFGEMSALELAARLAWFLEKEDAWAKLTR